MRVQDDVIGQVKALLGNVLGLGNRTALLEADTQLLGSLPELDSMAVATVLAAVEEQFGILIDDSRISADIFETVGTLAAFVEDHLSFEDRGA